jgi:hypothetical protein
MDMISMAVAKKNTKQLVEKVKNGALTTEYYAVEIVKMAQDGLGLVKTALQPESSSTDVLTVGFAFYPVIFKDGIQYKLVDAPFDYIYINGAIWSNKHQFKKVGITSPVIAEQLGITDILWFDTTLPKLMEHFGMGGSGDYEFLFMDASINGEIEGIIETIFTVLGPHMSALQVKGLWDLILANPETKLIFEYENQENIPVIDAPYTYDAIPVDIGGFDNEN